MLAVESGERRAESGEGGNAFGVDYGLMIKERNAETQRLSDVISRLEERLNEPFVTVNTVTGDKGIQKAQDDYEKLMRNKRPKTKKR